MLQNEKQISPVSIWVFGEDKIADILRLVVFTGYDFLGNSGQVSFELRNDLELIFNGAVEIPDAIIQQWGADDQIIFDYVAQQLNLTLA